MEQKFFKETGRSYNVSRSHACPICGKTDYCNYVDFPSGKFLAYCHRIGDAPGEVGSFSGQMWRLSHFTPRGFAVWETLEQWQRNEDERKKNGRGSRNTSGGNLGDLAVTRPVKKQEVYEGANEPLSPKELDRFYRGFLDGLVLEGKHRKILEAEWGKVPGLTDRILATYPIKSLPPYDVVRYSADDKFSYDNKKSRKRIMEDFVETYGEPRGVRGFYKKESGAWELSCKGGILYPEMDENGYVVGLRYADDYALVKVKDDDDETVEVYEYGIYEEGQPAGWFCTRKGGERTRVWTFGSDNNKVSLDRKGYPAVKGGKVEGKYKAVSSQRWDIVEEEERIVYRNHYKDGTRHVTRPSVYMKNGDDCKVVYVTEGEKKAAVANMLLSNPVITLPGVGSIGYLFGSKEGKAILESLKAKGMRIIVICLDADKAVNKMVLRAEAAGVQEALENGYRIAIGEWNPAWGKGLDDALLVGVKPKVYPVQ